MVDHLIAFSSVFFTNVFYTYYLKAVAEDKHFLAAAWSLVISVVASITVIFYINNHLTLISACIGSFFGTYIGMKFKNKE